MAKKRHEHAIVKTLQKVTKRIIYLKLKYLTIKRRFESLKNQHFFFLLIVRFKLLNRKKRFIFFYPIKR